MLHPPSRVYYVDPWTGSVFGEGGVDSASSPQGLDRSHNSPSSSDLEVLKGGVIMPKLGNETAKSIHTLLLLLNAVLNLHICCRAELGRASWKLMHTMTLRYPEVRGSH